MNGKGSHSIIKQACDYVIVTLINKTAGKIMNRIF